MLFMRRTVLILMTGLLTIVSSGASWASEVSVDALLGFNGGLHLRYDCLPSSFFCLLGC